MDYVDRLKSLREDRDLKQIEIAKILNKSQQGYAHLENRKAKFTVDDIIKLAEFYKVSTDYILLGKKEKTKDYTNKNNVSVTNNGDGNIRIGNIKQK